MRIKLILSIIASFLIPTIIYTNYLLYYFYNGKATLLDAGWFSYLITHSNNWNISNPPILASTNLGDSFLSTHISLFFHILSIIYDKFLSFLPIDIYFILFIATSYGVISLAIFIAGLNLIDKTDNSKLLSLWIISILTPFNGVALALVGFPHIEIAIASYILLFISLYFSGYKRASLLVVLFLLLIREDAGLHLFALLSVIILTQAIYNKSLKVDYYLLTVAILSLIYSIVAISIQKIYFTTDNALVRIYLGSPMLAHLNIDFIKDRVIFLLENREYIYIPAIFTIIISIASKNLFLLSSLLANSAWIVLSIIAITDMPGRLSNYYAFPLIVTLSWPIPAFLIYKVYTKRENIKYLILSIIFITLSSIALFPNNKANADNNPFKGFIFINPTKIYTTHKLISTIKSNKKELGNILFDEAISAFMVEDLKLSEYGYLNHFSKEQISNANSVVFCQSKDIEKPSYKIMKQIIKKQHMRYIYIVKGTDFIIASQFDNLPDILDIELKRVSISSL